MIDVDLALAVTTGMVFTVNPCGFAMLPAYLSFFVGVEQGADVAADARASVARALAVAIAVTVGFATSYALLGLVVSRLTDGVYDVAPWVSVLIGLALVSFGVALLAGYAPNLRTPHLDKGGRTRGFGSMVLFGVSYAVASLGCTLGLFLGVMSTNFGRGFASGVAYFSAFAAGFFLVVASLTVAIALAEHSLVRTVRRVLPFVNRIAGALLVLTGAYVAWYGVVSIRTPTSSDGVVDKVTLWSSDASDWVQRTGGTTIALVLSTVITAAAAFVFFSRRGARTSS
ncbi:MAG: cytochrome c-type biosis protein [Acidimicrobiaceae bacterium]